MRQGTLERESGPHARHPAPRGARLLLWAMAARLSEAKTCDSAGPMPREPRSEEPLSTGFWSSDGTERGLAAASPSGVASAAPFDYLPASGLCSLRLEA